MANKHGAMVRAVPEDMAGRLIVALDLPSIAAAEGMVALLDGVVSFFKLGLGLLFAPGVDQLITRLTSGGRRLFLDAKLFDIPETVARAVARVAERGASFLTVHGDPRILEAAVAARGDAPLRIFAVTVLTSLDDAALAEMGYALTARALVHQRARQAVAAGCDGVIASAADDPDALRRFAGSPNLLIATPGIRPAGSAADDQRRIATPGAAIAAGADYLVVGRPIIAAADPRASALAIMAEMAAA